MNNKFFITFFLFLYCFAVSSQDVEIKKDKSFAISFDTFFGLESNRYQDFGLATINLEYITKKNEFLSNGYSIGVLFLNYDDGLYAPRIPIINLQYDLIIGKRNNMFETGIGFYVPYLLNFKIGYRAYIGKRLLFRLNYTPYVFVFYESSIFKPAGNAFTASLGYRFGLNIPKQKWDKNVSWLAGMQLNWQPLYRHYKDVAGNEMSVNLEFLLARSGNLRFKAKVGFGYSISKHNYVKYYLTSLPAGFSIMYGSEKHFIETGLRASWTPIGGNSDGTFFTLQPELGYRIHLWKHFMARVAYTPYWWLSDKKGREYIEKKFVNSITVGVGIRFH